MGAPRPVKTEAFPAGCHGHPRRGVGRLREHNLSGVALLSFPVPAKGSPGQLHHEQSHPRGRTHPARPAGLVAVALGELALRAWGFLSSSRPAPWLSTGRPQGDATRPSRSTTVPTSWGRASERAGLAGWRKAWASGGVYWPRVCYSSGASHDRRTDFGEPARVVARRSRNGFHGVPQISWCDREPWPSGWQGKLGPRAPPARA